MKRRLWPIGIAFACGLLTASPFGIAAVAQTARALTQAELTTHQSVQDAKLAALEATVAKLEAAQKNDANQTQLEPLNKHVDALLLTSNAMQDNVKAMNGKLSALQNHVHCLPGLAGAFSFQPSGLGAPELFVFAHKTGGASFKMTTPPIISSAQTSC